MHRNGPEAIGSARLGLKASTRVGCLTSSGHEKRKLLTDDVHSLGGAALLGTGWSKDIRPFEASCAVTKVQQNRQYNPLHRTLFHGEVKNSTIASKEGL